MKLAIVYDRVNKFGGAERVLLALHEIWPEAPLYTAVYDKKHASWANSWKVHPSFMQFIPFAKNHHEWFPWLTPMAFESFSFDEFDVVLSVTSAEAKTIITKPSTMHICYCLTPTRYLWSGALEYHSVSIGVPKRLSSSILTHIRPVLQRWDVVSSSRPDYYVAISKRVSDRIKTYYQRSVSSIIYPPVDMLRFTQAIPQKQKNLGEYFLVVGRLVGYKRIDVIIQAFNQLGWPLIVIGDGWERESLMSIARSNIRCISRHLTDDELVHYYQNCRAFVFAGDEDFGLAAVEAQACGKPVVAYRYSGIAEIIEENKTGLLYDEQTAQSLVCALKQYKEECYDSSLCQKNAERFSLDRFKKEMKKTVHTLFHQYQ